MSRVIGQIQDVIFSDFLSKNRGGWYVLQPGSKGVSCKKEKQLFQEAKGFVYAVGRPLEELAATGTRTVPAILSRDCAQEALQMAKQPIWLSRKLRLCSIKPEPRPGPVRGCAVLLDLS